MYNQPTTPQQHAGTVSHASATQMRVGLSSVLDHGWLEYGDITVTMLSAPVQIDGDRELTLETRIGGELDAANGGRLFLKYSNGAIVNLWQNTAPTNGTQTVEYDFTSPTGIASVQVGTEVVLDRGHLSFDDVTLTTYSEAIPAAAGTTFQLQAQVTGETLTGLGQGGKITAAYFDASGQSVGTAVLWRNPVLFSGTTQVQVTFIANAGSATMKISLEANLSAGHLTFNELELEYLDSGDITERSTYSVAGQAIAVRVKTISAATGTNTDDIYFIYSDHLGSTSIMSYADGTVVPNSEARYLPFGDWRTEPTAVGTDGAPITDRGYTGHKSNNLGNNDIGLIYMNARYYIPYIYRMASPDTIVPDPQNPQSYNRYSYVRNNPVNFKDPTGNRECASDEWCAADSPEANYQPPSPVSPSVEYKTIPASLYLQEFLEYMGISQSSFNILVHSNDVPSNPDLYRYEIGAWILIQEQASFHPLSYPAGTENGEFFAERGLYTSVVLLQVIQSREQNYLDGRINLFDWIQENPQSGQFAYPPDSIQVDQRIYNDFLILAYLVEQGDLPDFLVSYPDTPTSANPSGRPIFYGHYDLVVGVGEYAHGRDSLSVSSWAWAQTDWIPSLEDFYGVIGLSN